MLPLQKAQTIALQIVEALYPYCLQIDIAGSIRRLRPFCGDIDLVILPKPDQLTALQARCAQHATLVQGQQQNLIYRLKNGTQLDLFIARPEAKDLFETVHTNYGSLLLCRTGSKEHNIKLIQHAKTLDLVWNPYFGVFRGRKCLASATEEEIFKALNLAYLPPENREV